MLSEKSRPYIDASVPVLRDHGVAITQRFYRTMFDEYPSLTNLFNMGNQANGSQQQSLASAVFAYAANYNNAEALAPVLGRIAHKHASVGLTSAHYPIVGRHLLKAISDTLGDAATPELMMAWDEAYWLIAGELIAAESRLYERASVGPGHHNIMRVTERVTQAEDIVSFTLVPESGEQPASFHPGQYVTVVVEMRRGIYQQRQYSLSDAPNGKNWRISVRRERGVDANPVGAVSNWLHDNIHVGATLAVSHPFGDFAPALNDAEPMVLLSAGVGITPMVSVLNALASQGTHRKVVFGHAARSRSYLAHLRDIEAAGHRLPQLERHFYLESGEAAELTGTSTRSGRMDAGELVSEDPDLSRATFYLCGPLRFMQAQRASLLARGIATDRIYREVFGPDLLDHLL
ncbi:globin domain-containing protein [Burkholderia catarinensis]|uniref:globin domain-containing protein n=1 Tax=Burkholderia catarinensis TaxID=1108140 RepID=UPI00091654E3|nr:globin domain-containing protein [Burkholderia catarinensis]KAG8155014.1 flavohemoprotein [Burkholderia catarinensis]